MEFFFPNIYSEIDWSRGHEFMDKELQKFIKEAEFGRSVVSLAILADESETWKPKQYEHELWGCKINFEYPIVKLRDYRDRWSELEKETNPFAVVVMAHLKTLETRKDANSRLRWKIELMRQLYNRGFSRREVINLLKFIDWIMLLPEELKKGFWNEVHIMQEERKMKYITTS